MGFAPLWVELGLQLQAAIVGYIWYVVIGVGVTYYLYKDYKEKHSKTKLK